jgi:hypothetical protein
MMEKIIISELIKRVHLLKNNNNSFHQCGKLKILFIAGIMAKATMVPPT